MRASTVLLLCFLFAGCAGEEASAPVYESVQAEIRSIEVSVGSAGVVEPLATVEVKSKASGEILELLVETGDIVEAGALLVRIDPRTVRNRLAQAAAELKAAQSRNVIAKSQMLRAESLVKKGTFTQTDYEQAVLELANAEAQVVSSQVNVENARIAVDDTEIRAPVKGTVIDKPVERGQVISSPTQDVGGGTLLLKMADLSAVQIRALIDETDIGKVRPGMPANVTVAAYPNQPFTGEVIKIEPLAIVEQNVTMFAVLISLQNPQGLLMPGMNAEIDVSIARRTDVLTVPVMALRTERDIATTASIIGISEAELRAKLQPAGEPGASGDAPATISLGGRSIALPPGVEAEKIRGLMTKRRNGGNLSDADRRLLRRVLQQSAAASDSGAKRRKAASDYRFGGNFWMVVETDGELDIVNVRAGLTDLDYVEIISGLDTKHKVLILPSAHLVETQEQLQRFINRRVGGVPGINTRKK